MTDESKTAVSADSTGVVPSEPQLPILRFRLRHLFGLTTAVCVGLAGLMAAQGPSYAQLALLLAAAVIVLHLTSTAIGSRLRAHADECLAWHATHDGRLDRGEPAATNHAAATITNVCSPSTLHYRGVPTRWMPLCTGLGALAGGILGAVLLATTIGGRASMVGVLFGAFSTAALGGWFAYLGGSFWAIVRQGWREAVAEPHWDSADQGSKSATLS